MERTQEIEIIWFIKYTWSLELWGRMGILSFNIRLTTQETIYINLLPSKHRQHCSSLREKLYFLSLQSYSAGGKVYIKIIMYNLGAL